ncbi:N-acetyltransferase family protein [Actinoplanes sp. CA-051413]|uniref:GNAT family N-acetyltransferase n=1 Tax=Actinoplanes sp. CA-051413 TaxID=3239899 RepID=UPI003D966B55
MNASVRAATAGDVAAICRICTDAYRDTYAGLLSGDYVERVIAEFYNPERVTGEIAASPPGWLGYQVVEEHGRVLGAAGGGMTGPGVGELFVIYLDPAELGRGLGTLLLNRIIEQVTELGAEELWASVVVDNTKGIPFYRARGFEEVSKRKAYGAGPEDDVWTWRMRKLIP